MIYYADAAGSTVRCVPERVHQGGAEGNKLLLIAPFAAGGSVWAAFSLPDGTVTQRFRLSYEGAFAGLCDEAGNAVNGWSLSLPVSVSAQYGDVTVQFYYSQGDKEIAGGAAVFTVERGVASELPESPAEDVYAQIVQAVDALSSDVNNGYYAARALYGWNSSYSYGANEVVFVPDAGECGALVRSKAANNLGNPPYTDGVADTAHWEEVLHFGNVAAQFREELSALAVRAESAESAAGSAASAAQGAAEEAQASAQAAQSAAGSAAVAAAEQVEQSLAASLFAAQTAAGEAQAANASAQAYAEESLSNKTYSGIYCTQAETYAKKAEEYKDLAAQYAQEGIAPNLDYASVAELPAEGSTKFLYLIPEEGGEEFNRYSEYIWVPSAGTYEFVGTTGVDLSGYAKTTGEYKDMSVGSAQSASFALRANVLSRCFEVGGEQEGWYRVGTVTPAMLAQVSEGDGRYECILTSRTSEGAAGILRVAGEVSGGVFSQMKVSVLAGSIAAADFCVSTGSSSFDLYCKCASGVRRGFTFLDESFAGTSGNIFMISVSYFGSAHPSGVSGVSEAGDGEGNLLDAVFARKSGTYEGLSVGNATKATSAESAQTASTADYATTAGTCYRAEVADTATNASVAASATDAVNAQFAESPETGDDSNKIATTNFLVAVSLHSGTIWEESGYVTLTYRGKGYQVRRENPEIFSRTTAAVHISRSANVVTVSFEGILDSNIPLNTQTQILTGLPKPVVPVFGCASVNKPTYPVTARIDAEGAFTVTSPVAALATGTKLSCSVVYITAE